MDDLIELVARDAAHLIAILLALVGEAEQGADFAERNTQPTRAPDEVDQFQVIRREAALAAEAASRWRQQDDTLAINIFGPFDGWFATVTGIAADRQGRVFVEDFYNDRVQKFAAAGSVFVVDYANNRVQNFRPSG